MLCNGIDMLSDTHGFEEPGHHVLFKIKGFLQQFHPGLALDPVGAGGCRQAGDVQVTGLIDLHG